MTTSLIPQPFWFRPAFRAPRLAGIPIKNSVGRLLNLDDTCLLPSLGNLNGQANWSRIWVAWNPKGLAIAAEVTGKPGRVQDAHNSLSFDGINIWVDTRDTRDIHRASRYCHKLSVILSPKPKGDGLDVTTEPQKIARAAADAPLPEADSYLARAAWIRQGWLLEVFLPAETLQGFDPETNRRLGFNVQVCDLERGDEFLTGLGREFPQGEDPSLWATLELGE